jgi:hypothetical protein
MSNNPVRSRRTKDSETDPYGVSGPNLDLSGPEDEDSGILGWVFASKLGCKCISLGTRNNE